MSSPLTQLLRLPSAMLEFGLTTAQKTFEAAQQTLESLTDQKKGQLTGAPVKGPHNMDTAVSDFAERAARIIRYMPLATSEIPEASRALAEAAKRSFGYLDFTDPKNAIVPLQMLFSVGSLAAQSALRGLMTYEMLGPTKIQTLLVDFFDMFTELQVFVGLEYREVIDKCEERLEKAPDDYRIRYELGETLVKCGLYEQAIREVRQIPADSSYYANGLHEGCVALHRSGRMEESARMAIEALDANPNERTRSWLWLTAQKMGGYPEFVPEHYRLKLKAGYEKPVVEFEDIAPRLGLDKTSAGRGIAIFDYDGDGYLDILIAAAHGGCNLYHNNGDGTFTDVSINSGFDSCVNGFSPIVGDYNNDGLPDVFVTRLGFYSGECQLFRNNGDGTFTDVTEEAGLKVWGPGFTPSWIDYDRDGHLDLFIANNLGGLFERKTPNRLFHNNGDGTFTEVAEQAGLSTMWPTIGGAWGDYDNDGYPDLFLSNGLGRSQLYKNNHDGTFTDVSREAGVDSICFGSPAFWWDYDNDGWLDIAQFVWSDHEDVLYTLEHGEGPADGHPMRVYRNNRDGTFTEVGREIGFVGCHGTMSGNCADINNDGNLDIVLGNGSPKMDRLEPMIVMENDGTKFRNITFAAGFPYLGKSHGVNMADLFGDGRMSVLIAAGGAYPGDLLTTNVFYPKELAGNYLNVRLKGTISNRSAIGSRVSIEAGGKKQMREVVGGSNFGCLPLEQHFGLAKTETVDSLEIRWPNGLVQKFGPIEANQTIEFTEGEEAWRDVYAGRTNATTA